jgi:hypothetical protein
MTFRLRGNWNSNIADVADSGTSQTPLSANREIKAEIKPDLKPEISIKAPEKEKIPQEKLLFRHIFYPSISVENYENCFFRFPLDDVSRIKIVIYGSFDSTITFKLQNKESEYDLASYTAEAEGLTIISFTSLVLRTLNLYDLKYEKAESSDDTSEIYSIEVYQILAQGVL